MIDLMKQAHRLVSKNVDTMTGVCIVCGPTGLLARKNGVRCATARRSQRNHLGSNGTDTGRSQYHGMLRKLAKRLCELIGHCQVCSKVTLRLVVDHNHQNKRIRGVLCHNCNRGIGLLGDDPERLELAAAYLKRPPIDKTVRQTEQWVLRQ